MSRFLELYRSLLPIACVALARVSGAQSVFHGAPPASWIAPADVPSTAFVVFHARRAFDVETVPRHFTIHVSADNRYWLWLNGVMISSGPQRSDVEHWRYETVDLARNLKVGRNIMAAVAWSWGSARPVAQHSFRPAFLVQGDGASEAALVNTGPGWKLVVDSAYSPVVITNATVASYYAAPP